ncbi:MULTISPECIES: LytR/AlgR family response regulator transcription factor [Dorea]|uniref:Stage 0 sporulation protein A homolog n=1 Tax=Dorea formicigenerans TaxID=39486 RepID=A0A564U523_9FIRM|nr:MULTISPECIES: LytTR family DNA-binding domain-containing protein [Dorea]VUX14619.1 Transcriptional regulatory protein YpdB [Dorea formicigenerans]
MFKIAVAEDEDIFAEELRNYFGRFEEESGERFCVTYYKDGDDLVQEYQSQFDLILMDIQMKFMDGMSAAEEIRAVDSKVVIIFITNMTQYAVKGYEVDAMDYILKPVKYFTFSQKLERALSRIKQRREIFMSIAVKGGMYRISVEELLYIESQGHTLNYHTQKEVISVRANLSEMETELRMHGFSRINKGCIVNMKYVDMVMNGECYVNGGALPIARNRKKSFMDELTEYIRGEI